MCRTASFSDLFFRFMEEGETRSSYSDDEDDENSFDVNESRAFWNSQEELLQVLTVVSDLIDFELDLVILIWIRSETEEMPDTEVRRWGIYVMRFFEFDLQATIRRTSSIELRIRRATVEIVRELNIESTICECGRSAAGDCRSCWRREICNRLQLAGFNCAVCKSKWRSSLDIPSGN